MLKLGERFLTNFSGELQIIGFEDGKYKVRFFKTGYITSAKCNKIKLGKVKDKLLPRVYGIGFIGEGLYNAKTHRKIYERWKKMLARCYSGNFPEYAGITVCERWFNFQNFAYDFFNLPGYQEDIKGLDLDKDMRVKGNKIYSPDTCQLIPHSINFSYAVRGV